MKKLIIVLWALNYCAFVFADTDYPMLQLDNQKIQVSIYLPDANRGYYRGTRFDWSGIIERVDYDGHRFYAPLHATHDPNGHDFVSGPAEEFAMFNPMGFAEAKEGESFVKIGVGLLEKNKKSEYQFYGKYRIIRAGEWQIEHGRDWVSFNQDFKGERGWAYQYQKTIRLIPDRPELVIEHRLENSGEKTIDINHYNHNFTIIDDIPYGPDYLVEFPFATDQPVSIKNLAWYRGNSIEVMEPLQNNSIGISVFEGDDPGGYNSAKVRNLRTGAAVEFSGSAPITRMAFWAVERAACPEPFINLNLSPGQSQEWTIHYRFISDTQ
ncbi:MAG: hypothetical protein WBM41_17765 [Arenicellales bacterium]